MTADIFDRAGALRLLSGRQDLLCELARLFLQEGPRLWQQVHDAASRSDMHELERAVHSIRGATVYYQSRLFAQSCQRLQAAAQADSSSEAGKVLPDFDRHYKQLYQALSELSAQS